MTVLPEGGLELGLQIRVRRGLRPRYRSPPSVRGGEAPLPRKESAGAEPQFFGDDFGGFCHWRASY